jgi:hypothetical protein
MTTKSIEVPMLREILRADPDWARDERLIPELDGSDLPAARRAVLVNWRSRGPYSA